MPMYIVSGIDQQTGAEREVEVNANTEAEAARAVSKQHGLAIMPNGVRRADHGQAAGPTGDAGAAGAAPRLGYRGVRKAMAQVVIGLGLMNGGLLMAATTTVDGGGGLGLVIAAAGLIWLVVLAVKSPD